jgi:hypothetical protein
MILALHLSRVERAWTQEPPELARHRRPSPSKGAWKSEAAFLNGVVGFWKQFSVIRDSVPVDARGQAIFNHDTLQTETRVIDITVSTTEIISCSSSYI